HCPSPFPDQCATASPVIVDLDSQRTLPPGTYGNVVVFSAGSRSGRLVLTGGEYLFCSLRTGRSARILVQRPSTVMIQNELNLGASAYLGPDPDVSPLPLAGDITLYVNGPAVRFSASSEAHAHVYAPNAMLRLTHEATIPGPARDLRQLHRRRQQRPHRLRGSRLLRRGAELRHDGAPGPAEAARRDQQAAPQDDPRRDRSRQREPSPAGRLPPDPARRRD